MILTIQKFLLAVVMTAVLGACTFNFPGGASTTAEAIVIPVGTVKPDLDYSSESPSCELAAQRISDNIQVGMTTKDVRRLVGSPSVIFAGSWHWAPGFAKSGLPVVKFRGGRGSGNNTVASFSIETDAC